MKHKLIVMMGLPASGKSTWAKNWVDADPLTRIRVNRDDLRAMMTSGPYDYGVDTYIRDLEVELVNKMLFDGKMDVVVDDTNLKAKDIILWQHMADSHQVEIIYMRLDTPVHECVDRNAARLSGKIPTEAIEKMAQSKYLTIPIENLYNEAFKEING